MGERKKKKKIWYWVTFYHHDGKTERERGNGQKQRTTDKLTETKTEIEYLIKQQMRMLFAGNCSIVTEGKYEKRLKRLISESIIAPTLPMKWRGSVSLSVCRRANEDKIQWVNAFFWQFLIPFNGDFLN